MRILTRPLAVGTVALVLAGCGQAARPTASVAPESGAPASEPASGGRSATGATGAPHATETEDPIAADDLGTFSCDLPLHVDATVPRANLTHLRVGNHPGFDRVVFEFQQGVPEVWIERAEPPFTQDGSGLPMDIEGESFLRITMRGGTKQMDDGSSSYSGSTNLNPGLPTLTHLVEAGDFEAQSTWYAGLAAGACVRVVTLTDEGAPRLVIDLEG